MCSYTGKQRSHYTCEANPTRIQETFVVSLKSKHTALCNSLQFHHRYILGGLILSGIGDALLIWHETQFVSAMAAFGLAHLAYIVAFGLETQDCWYKPLPFVAFTFIGIYILYPGLTGILVPGVIIYISLINVMVWKAFSQVDIMENVWSWTKLCACVGAVLFLISDFTIGLNKFCFTVPGSRVIVMVTYYAAQCFIALSAANTDDLVTDLRRKMK